MGHLLRCEALAHALQGLAACEIHFALRGSDQAAARIERAGWKLIRLPLEAGVAADVLASQASELAASAVIFDVRDPVPERSLDALRQRPTVLALIDDESPMRLAMDLIFSPPMPQALSLDGSGLRGAHYIGWDWIPLRQSFAEAAAIAPAALADDAPLLVCMGGADPAGLTFKAMYALEQIEAFVPITIVIGEFCAYEQSLRGLCARSRHRIVLRKAVEDMPTLMRTHGFALASFGVTAYELTALGLPALYLSLTPDHAVCAAELERHGVARHLGLGSDVSEKEIARALCELHGGRDIRGAMAQRARSLIDGLGASRIAAAILEQVDKQDV